MTAPDASAANVRIWHQSFTVLEDLPAYRDLLHLHLHRVARPGVTIDLHGMQPGTYPTNYPGTHIRYLALQHFHKEQFIRAALLAEEQDYDAFLIATIPDTAFEEIRTLVDIPVIAFGHASIAMASTVGSNIGMVNFIDELGPQVQENARRYGFSGLLGPVERIERPFTAILAGYEDPEPLVDAFHVAARRAIARGAEVLIPGEGPLNLFLADQGVHRVDDVPVLDSLAASLKFCEARVDLHRQSDLRPSRNGYFHARPPADLVQAALAFYTNAPHLA